VKCEYQSKQSGKAIVSQARLFILPKDSEKSSGNETRKATLSNVGSTRLTIEAKAVDAGTPTAQNTIICSKVHVAEYYNKPSPYKPSPYTKIVSCPDPTHKGRGSGYTSLISWASGSAEAL